jgi:hypothetical protein
MTFDEPAVSRELGQLRRRVSWRRTEEFLAAIEAARDMDDFKTNFLPDLEDMGPVVGAGGDWSGETRTGYCRGVRHG